MRKYDEIMEHLVVTEEMKQRILSNVNETSVKKKKTVIPFTSYQKQMGIAACFAVLVLAAFLTRGKFWDLPQNKASAPSSQEELTANPDSGMSGSDGLESSVPSSKDEPMAGSSYGIVELEDTAALSEAVGFPVEDLTSLPFEVRQVTYCSYFNNFAEIDYTGDGQSLSYRKAKGTEDISGDWNEYSNERHLTVNDLDILLKGHSEKYTLASWTDGTYAYALSFEQEVAEEEITAIISSMSVMNYFFTFSIPKARRSSLTMTGICLKKFPGSPKQDKEAADK
ncbi:MAG: hypothetical protein MR817_10920 [Lachnospiraceae bacterium]|nr:hypothetical protein [Lachnospiraceae bacterium]